MSRRPFAPLFVLGFVIFPITLIADPLPAKDGGSIFGSHHGLGYSDGSLFLHTGDSIYSVDTSVPSDPGFALHMGGLRSAFPGPQRTFEGGFVTADGGRAMVSMGFTDGGVLDIDLSGKTAQPVSDFDVDNIFSAAGRSDRTFYAMWVDPGFATSTFVYHIDPGTRAATAAVDPAAGSGEASGAMAFDGSGNLVVGSFDFINGRANFHRILATDLLAFESQGTTPPTTFLGGSPANGSYNVILASNGTVFFNTTTGIGRFNPVQGTVANFYRDVLDPNLFNYDPFKQPLNGLAYDDSAQQLVFAEFNTTLDAYELVMLPIPEPTMMTLVSMAIAYAMFPSRRPGRTA